jgi:hypothetical protein
MGMEICSATPAIGGLRETAPAAGWGRCTAGHPGSFGCEAVSRPTGMSSGVQMRFSYVQAHKWPEAPDLAQYRAVLRGLASIQNRAEGYDLFQAPFDVSLGCHVHV